jgi:L-threonylcarbamoyladenylate synthase
MTADPRIRDLGAMGVLESLGLANELMAARLACFPTDTVYGVGGSLRPEVGEELMAAKGRADDKPLQVIFPTRELLLDSIEVSSALRDVFLRLLPGPLTLVIPYPPGLRYPPPGLVVREERGRLGRRPRETSVETLGVRVPHWPGPAKLLATLRFPLVASSANPSGGAPPGRIDEVDPALLAACDLVLDAGPVGGVASTVVDFSLYEDGRGWRILREGAVSAAQIDEMLTRKREDLPRP